MKRTKPYTPETLNIVFSSGKAVESIIIAYLVSKGLLSYDEKVSTYWPEFAAGNKQNVLLRDLMGHRGGVAYLDEDRVPTAEEILDLDTLANKIAGQEHNFGGEPKQSYHAVTRGWYLNEIVRRATGGKTMGQIIREEIAPELGIHRDFHYGLPDSEEHRLAHMIPFPHLRTMAMVLLPRWLVVDRMPIAMVGAMKDPQKIAMKTMKTVPTLKEKAKELPNGLWANSKSIRKAENPSFGAVGNARSVSRVILSSASFLHSSSKPPKSLPV